MHADGLVHSLPAVYAHVLLCSAGVNQRAHQEFMKASFNGKGQSKEVVRMGNLGH